MTTQTMTKETAIEKIKELITKADKLSENFMILNNKQRDALNKKTDVLYTKIEKLAKEFSVDTMKVMDEMKYPRFDKSGARI